MAKASIRTPSRRQRQRRQEELAWRVSRIKDWRKHRNMTQQQVADALGRLNLPIEYDRVSVQRTENGKQKPKIDIVEGLAKILGIDIESLLNRTPEEAATIQEFQGYDESERRRILRMVKAGKDD